MRYLIRFVLRAVPRHYLHRVAHAFLRVVSLFYRGDQFEDPITGITYRKMLPYGRGNPRPNALAPDSLSLERHRLFWLYLRDRTNFFTDHIKLLHLAPEYCFLHRFRQMDNLEYVTADLNSPWADIKMDVHDIPFPDNSFDVIFGNHLLEHVEDDRRVMREFYRVMRPGGWGIFMVPMDTSREKTYEDPSITDPREREKHFLQSDHLRLYGRDYPDRLREAGFTVIGDDYARQLDPALARRYSVSAGQVIYLCRKE